MLPRMTLVETVQRIAAKAPDRFADGTCYNMRIHAFLLVAAMLALLTPPARACGLDGTDRERELASIRNGLLSASLEPSDRIEAKRLLEIASVDPGSLGVSGLRLQAKARGDALKLLGLPRIPGWPSREFAAIA